MPLSPLRRDPHALYEASVLSAEYDLDFFARVYRRHRGRPFRLLREDFCGTAALACAWVRRGPRHYAWGVDHDPRVLAWAARHHLPRLRRAASRVALLRRDVRRLLHPKVDVVAAMNFSYWTFKGRDTLREYFRQARRSLRPGGMLFVNAFGGTEAMREMTERRRIRSSQGPDGLRIPGFTYVWEQVRFNPVDHHLLCHIHFRLGDGTWLRRAFHYDWRLWTLPEIQELMIEAGFRAAEVYVEGWDDEKGESDGIYRPRRRFTNQEGWLANIVGLR
jgi:SAM-dependent methyltransferase